MSKENLIRSPSWREIPTSVVLDTHCHNFLLSFFLVFNSNSDLSRSFKYPSSTKTYPLEKPHPSSSFVITQWFTYARSKFIHPCGWGRTRDKYFRVRSSWCSTYHPQSATYLYWPKLLHLISHYYTFWYQSNQVSGSVMLASFPLFLLSDFLTFSAQFSEEECSGQKRCRSFIRG